MQEININVTETGCQLSPLLIGYQGENEVTRVIADYSAWTEEFGAGSLALEVMRSGDEIPYLAPLTIADGKAVWLVSNVDTGSEGIGAAGFVYTVGDQIKKSAVFRFFVGRDIGGDPGERPDPYEGVIAHIEKLVKEAEENAAAAETAQGAAETAQRAAEAARDAAASSATDAAESASEAAEQAQGAATARAAAEAAQQAAKTAQTAAETAQTAAEAARDAAASSATDAAGSATTATEQAQAAATARAAAETAQTAAEAARDAAASSATDAAGSATTATQQAQAAATARAAAEAAQQAAETAKTAAENAQKAIEDLTVSAEEIDTAGPTVEKQVDPQTGTVNLNFGFAKNQATTSTTIGPAPIVTFDASAADMPLKSLTVNIEPVQEGSGDPSPENVRPISGWTGCKIIRGGENIILKNAKTSPGFINASGGITANSSYKYIVDYIPVTPNTTYCVSGDVFPGSAQDLYNTIAFYSTTQQFLSRYVPPTPRQGATFTTPADCHFVRANIGALCVLAEIQMEEGDTPTDLEIIPITFPTEASTVYGGTLDVTRGVLTVDRLFIEFDSSLNIGLIQHGSTSGGEVFPYYATVRYTLPSGVSSVNEYTKWRFSHGLAQRESYPGVWRFYTTSTNNVQMVIGTDTEITNLSELKSYFDAQKQAGTPVQGVCCITPKQEYAITSPQITTLLGTNNIWADCGDVTVTYGAYLETVKKHAEIVGDSILSAIAPLETSYTASRNYSVGDYLFVGTTFYKVISAISSGAVITVGTNVEQTTVEKQIKELHEIKTGTYTNVNSSVTSVNDFRCKQIGKTVEIHFYVSGNFTVTNAQIDLLVCEGITPPPIPIRATCGCGPNRNAVDGFGYCLLWTNRGIGVRIPEATSTIFVDFVYTVD